MGKSLTDAEVLAQSYEQMDKHQGQRFSQLLAQQREGDLSQQDKVELWALMEIYQNLWLRQSEALAEAVKRGL